MLLASTPLFSVTKEKDGIEIIGPKSTIMMHHL